ncbi:ferritin [Candidatus Bathyarchaeota archaeon]|nr:ferritin [Candidatus Bathyarchaeota archaeon]
MIDEKILEELNQQVQEETYSGYIYLAMAAWLDEEGYKGMANWMRVQAREEKIHADIFYNYILERGGHVKLQAIEAPPDKWKTPLELFKAALEHEEHITSRINHMVDVSLNVKDHATYQMLQWFIEEQVEEEANVGEAVQQLSIVGEEGRGILMVDREMSTRVFSVPASAPWYPKSGQPGSMAT